VKYTTNITNTTLNNSDDRIFEEASTVFWTLSNVLGLFIPQRSENYVFLRLQTERGPNPVGPFVKKVTITGPVSYLQQHKKDTMSKTVKAVTNG